MSVRDSNVNLTYLLRNNLKNMLKKVKVKRNASFFEIKKKKLSWYKKENLAKYQTIEKSKVQSNQILYPFSMIFSPAWILNICNQLRKHHFALLPGSHFSFLAFWKSSKDKNIGSFLSTLNTSSDHHTHHPYASFQVSSFNYGPKLSTIPPTSSGGHL